MNYEASQEAESSAKGFTNQATTQPYLDAVLLAGFQNFPASTGWEYGGQYGREFPGAAGEGSHSTPSNEEEDDEDEDEEGSNEDETQSVTSSLDFEEVLSALWRGWWAEIERRRTLADFKRTQLPLARVKKVMKLDPETCRITTEAVMVLSEACTQFIQHMTLLSLVETNRARRRVLRREDFVFGLPKDNMFDFLVDFIERDEEVQAASFEEEADD